tara:strand:+ start:1356 stop:1580 length:225 start_codon:yes stop_codon:yes gene_type:complete
MAGKIINGKKYNVFAFAKNKSIAESHAKKLRDQKPLNKGDKIFVKIEKIKYGYAVLAHSVLSKKTKQELNNMFK